MRPEASLTLMAADIAAYELTGLVKEGRLDRLPLFGHACCRLYAAPRDTEVLTGDCRVQVKGEAASSPGSVRAGRWLEV